MYEANLGVFHRSLAQQSIQGYLGSKTFRVGSLPWMPGVSPIYEDWYVLENSSALDSINKAAVSAAAKQPHDQLAGEAALGTGGLYRLRLGRAVTDGRFASWFAKPTGITYDDLDSLLESALTRAGSVWQRQMVLGPGYEFCLLSQTEPMLPARLTTLCIERRLVC